MAVAIDTFSNGGIHPKNKQLPSKRLAISALNVVYGQKEYPTNGPFPEFWDISQISEDLLAVDIFYGQHFTWNVLESEGFYVCCQESISDCNGEFGWEKVRPKDSM